MAKLPKIVYNGKKVSNVNYNGKDALNVVMDGLTVFHKHKENVCKFYHPASDIRCPGTITWSISSVSPSNNQFVDVTVQCNNCGQYWFVEPNDGRNHDKSGNRCNRILGTNPAYYSYSCGFDAT